MRVVTGTNPVSGQLIVWERRDFYPYGEEIRSVPIAPAAPPPTPDNQLKFTRQMRDAESGLDYFGARYYGNTLGRFMSVDPLLSSGSIYDPQTWNRYAYTLNNPLKYIDPFGLYVYAEGTTDEEKKKFEQGLKDLEKSRNAYKKGSADYNRLDAILKGYGAKGVDNGVTLRFAAAATPGNTGGFIKADPNTGAKVTTADNPTGQNIIVTIDPSRNKSGFDYATTIAHEGSHVLDYSALIGALPSDLTTTAAQAVLAGPLNITTYETETRGYFAGFLVSGGIASKYGVSSVSYGGFETWNAGWKQADATAKHAAGVDKLLAVPKSSGGGYGVTSSSPGKKIFE